MSNQVQRFERVQADCLALYKIKNERYGNSFESTLDSWGLTPIGIRLEDKERKLREATERIDADRPKVVFANAIMGSSNSCLIGELAKLIRQNGYNIGEKRLFEWLRTNGYLGRKGERYNQPTQKALEKGLFELRKVTINVGDHTKVRTTTKVTGKGQVYFVNKFLYNQEQKQ